MHLSGRSSGIGAHLPNRGTSVARKSEHADTKKPEHASGICATTPRSRSRRRGALATQGGEPALRCPRIPRTIDLFGY